MTAEVVPKQAVQQIVEKLTPALLVHPFAISSPSRVQRNS